MLRTVAWLQGFRVQGLGLRMRRTVAWLQRSKSVDMATQTYRMKKKRSDVAKEIYRMEKKRIVCLFGLLRMLRTVADSNVPATEQVSPIQVDMAKETYRMKKKRNDMAKETCDGANQ